VAAEAVALGNLVDEVRDLGALEVEARLGRDWRLREGSRARQGEHCNAKSGALVQLRSDELAT
jgi:hypothetical protein